MKRVINNNPIRQLGISLLEVLLSLSIIAIILVMATRYFFVANNNDKINMVRQEVGSLVAGINAWKNQNPTYSQDLTIQTLSEEGFLANSRSLKQDKTALYDPWGGEIQLSIGENNHSAKITVTLPNNNDCNALQNSYPDGNCQQRVFTLVVQ